MQLKVNIEGKWATVYVLIRPYVKEFLQKMSSLYELVIFTASLPNYANPVIDRLPNGMLISHRLYRHHCVDTGRIYIKMMKKLGRDVKDVIIIDNNPPSYIQDKNNGIPILTWLEDKNDNELLKLIPVLEFLSKVNDVRDYIPQFITGSFINYNLISRIMIEQSKSQQKKSSNSNNQSQESININIYNQNYSNYILNNVGNNDYNNTSVVSSQENKKLLGRYNQDNSDQLSDSSKISSNNYSISNDNSYLKRFLTNKNDYANKTSKNFYRSPYDDNFISQEKNRIPISNRIKNDFDNSSNEFLQSRAKIEVEKRNILSESQTKLNSVNTNTNSNYSFNQGFIDRKPQLSNTLSKPSTLIRNKNYTDTPIKLNLKDENLFNDIKLDKPSDIKTDLHRYSIKVNKPVLRPSTALEFSNVTNEINKYLDYQDSVDYQRELNSNKPIVNVKKNNNQVLFEYSNNKSAPISNISSNNNNNIETNKQNLEIRHNEIKNYYKNINEVSNTNMNMNIQSNYLNNTNNINEDYENRINSGYNRNMQEEFSNYKAKYNNYESFNDQSKKSLRSSSYTPNHYASNRSTQGNSNIISKNVSNTMSYANFNSNKITSYSVLNNNNKYNSNDFPNNLENTSYSKNNNLSNLNYSFSDFSLRNNNKIGNLSSSYSKFSPNKIDISENTSLSQLDAYYREKESDGILNRTFYNSNNNNERFYSRPLSSNQRQGQYDLNDSYNRYGDYNNSKILGLKESNNNLKIMLNRYDLERLNSYNY